MQSERRIMLFSPPLAPVELHDGASVVIGRQAQCDISLPHSDVSRRHAEVSREEEGSVVLRDLGSTNGTFLNGKEIHAPTPLAPGDRIELGSRVVTFCELTADDAALPPTLDGERTIVATHRPTSETFMGDLSQIPPYAVLQVLEMGRKSGVLGIEAEGLTCRIWLRDGVPIHAESGRQSGFDAAVRVVNLTRGRFHFEPGAAEVEATLACSVTQLLMEGCRLFDEGNASSGAG